MINWTIAIPEPLRNGVVDIEYSVNITGNTDTSIPSFFIMRYDSNNNGQKITSTETILALIPETTETSLNGSFSDAVFEKDIRYIYELKSLDKTVSYAMSEVITPRIRGVVISSSDGQSYFSELDWSVTSNLNITRTSVNTISSRYPYVINNTTNDYHSGSISATFLELDGCEYLTDNTWGYRTGLENFLKQFRPMLIRVEDGRSWIVMIVGNSISHSPNGNALHNVSTKFDWVEIGSAVSADDLRKYGFIR